MISSIRTYEKPHEQLHSIVPLPPFVGCSRARAHGAAVCYGLTMQNLLSDACRSIFLRQSCIYLRWREPESYQHGHEVWMFDVEKMTTTALKGTVSILHQSIE